MACAALGWLIAIFFPVREPITEYGVLLTGRSGSVAVANAAPCASCCTASPRRGCGPPSTIPSGDRTS